MGVFGDILSGVMDAGNFALSMGAQAWQKQAQEKTWEREDNAIQRRVADMKAAGINPLLAAGNPAQASSPIQVGVPQASLENVSALTSVSRSKQDIARSKTEQVLMGEQMKLAQANTQEAVARARAASIDADTKKWDLDTSKLRKLRTTDRGITNEILSAISGLGGLLTKDSPLTDLWGRVFPENKNTGSPAPSPEFNVKDGWIVRPVKDAFGNVTGWKKVAPVPTTQQETGRVTTGRGQ